MALLDEYNEEKRKKTPVSTQSNRKSLLQEYVDDNGYGNLNKKYTDKALSNGGGFGATATGTVSSRNVDSNYINTFISDAQKYFDSVQGDYDLMGYNNASSIYSSHFNRLKDLKNRYRAISQYVHDNRGRLDEETYNSFTSSLEEYRKGLDDAQDALKSKNNIFSQFKTEDDYNSYVSEQKKQAEQLKMDTEAGQIEVDDLKKRYENAKSIYNTIQSKWRGISDLETIPAYQEDMRYLKSALGEYKTFEDMEKDFTQKAQYLNQAKRLQNGAKLRDDAFNAKDFDAYSEMGANIENPTFKDVEGDASGINIFGWRPWGEDIGNIVKYSRDNWEQIAMGEAEDSQMEGRSIYRWMTDEEYAIYNYYPAKDKENGTKAEAII